MIGLLAPLIGGTVKTMCMSMLSEKLLQQVHQPSIRFPVPVFRLSPLFC